MRVGVLSDSHGFTGRLSTILMVMEAGGPIDALIHLGDGYDDLRALEVPLPPVYQVAGNCDFFRSDTLDTVCLSGARLLLTHGHRQHVKEGLGDLMSLALRENVHAALIGHTHVQQCRWENGLLLLNPGAVTDGKFAVLTISRLGAIEPALLSLDKA